MDKELQIVALHLPLSIPQILYFSLVAGTSMYILICTIASSPPFHWQLLQIWFCDPKHSLRYSHRMTCIGVLAFYVAIWCIILIIVQDLHPQWLSHQCPDDLIFTLVLYILFPFLIFLSNNLQALPTAWLSVTEMWTVTFSSSLAVCEIWISSALFIIGSYFMTCRVVFRRRRAWGTVMELHRAVNIGCCPAPIAVGEEGRNRPKYCWTMLPSSWFK